MKAGGELRPRLRAATEKIHERLHGHAGLGAAASGSIALGDYRLLLARLWGFHKAFEQVIEAAACGLDLTIDMKSRARAPMLEADLATLGCSAREIAGLPHCDYMFRPRSAPACLGALYVVEGSTLGGLHIARALSGLFEGAEGEGRKFFLGYGADHGAMWRGFLEQLDHMTGQEACETEAIEGAVRTFADFERWMEDWRHCSPSPGSKAAMI